MHKLEKLILELYSEAEDTKRTLKPKDLPKDFLAGIEKRYGKINMEKDFFNDDLTRYMKHMEVSDDEKEAGAIAHKVIKIASFEKMYDDFQNIVDDIKKLMADKDVRNDQAARDLFELIRTNFRKLQGYLRKNRPDQYALIRGRVALAELYEMLSNHASLIKEEKLAKRIVSERKNEFAPGGKYWLPDDGYMAAKLRAEDGYFNPRGATETDASGDTPEDDAEFAIKNNMGVKDPEKIKKFIDGWMKYNQEVLDGTTKLVPYKPDPNRFFQKKRRSNPGKNPRYGKKTNALIQKLKAKRGVNESLLDQINEEEPQPEEPGKKSGPVLEDATDTILGKFPTLKAAIVKLQTEDFKEFIESIDWISPRPTSFRINLKNGQDYILKWTGKTFEAQILGKRYLLSNIADYQQALDKLAVLYKEAPMSGAGEGEGADTDTGGGGGGGGDFPGGEGGGEDLGDEAPDLGGEEGEEGGADLGGEEIDFEEPGEEPEV